MKSDKIFDSRESASCALADHIAAVLESAVTQRGNASIVVCGGTSPLETFRFLRQKKLPWHNVTIVPSDERLVTVDHEDSNEGMIRRELMQDEAAAAKFLSLAQAGIRNRQQLSDLNSQLNNLVKPIDVVMLGMGGDGHTASLFPNSESISAALGSDDACVVQHPPHLDDARLSLTPRLLLDAQEIVLLFFGDDKRATYEQAIDAGPVDDLPVRFLLHQERVSIRTYWAA